MTKRQPAGTNQQRVFDVITADGITFAEIVTATGIPERSVRSALYELMRHNRTESCRSQTLYRASPGSSRPSDGRGRKP